MNNINDKTNVTGIAKLFNKDKINTELDMEEIEKEVRSGSAVFKIEKEKDPLQEFRKNMKELAKTTGLNLDESDNEGDEGDESDEDEEEDEEESGEEEDGDSVSASSSVSRASSRKPETFRPEHKFGFDQKPRKPQQLLPPQQNSYKNHQQLQSTDPLENARRKYSGHDDKEDDINDLLGDIEEIREELEAEGVETTNIPVPDNTWTIEDIKHIHRKVKRKYDRIRCNSFGTETILAGAQGLEYLCDGKRNIGPFTPDLVGWPNSIRPKLRRMRYETSTIVSGIMNDYNIGPFTRILFELVPSMFVYSAMKKSQTDKKYYSPNDNEVSNALESLRDS